MTSTWMVILCSFLGTTLLVVAAISLTYELFFKYGDSLRTRVHNVTRQAQGAPQSRLVDFQELAKTASMAPRGWKRCISDLLDQAGMSMSARQLLLLSMTSGACATITVAIATRVYWAVPLALTFGLACPFLYVHCRRRHRLHKMTLQLPDALDVISRGVKAGQTVPAAFQMVADNFPPPLSEEFRYCYEQQNLGIPLDTALHNLASSTGVMELRILVVGLLIQARSGGNLTDLLNNLALLVRKRLALEHKVRALTGEGRMQAAVLIALPPLAFVSIFVLNREYAQALLDYPWLLATCAVLQVVGAVFIRRIININY